MIITVTETGSFKRCRQMWDFGSLNRQALEPIVNRPAFELGTLIHKAHESWAQGKDDFVDAYKKHGNESLERVKAEYRERVGAPISQVEFEPYLDAVELGLYMCVNYVKQWKSPLPEGFHFVAPEQTIYVPIPNSEHSCEDCNGKQYVGDEPCATCHGVGTAFDYLEGTLDGLVVNDKGALFILEHKTFGRHPNDDDLNQNDQFLAYIWIVMMMRETRNVGGILYDGMWKRDKPPKGRTFDDLFLRKILTRSLNEVMTLEQELPLIAADMRKGAIYRNVPWDSCNDCSYRKLCVAKTRGENIQPIIDTYFKKRVRTK